MTLLTKILPLSCSIVGFFCTGFLAIEFDLLLFLPELPDSLQHRMIRSKRYTLYSRSESFLMTKKVSCSRSSPNEVMSCPFQSSTRRPRSMTA